MPRFAGIVRADFRNNVVYNWGHTAGYGQFERVNYVGNFFRPGPSTTQKPPLFHTGLETVGKASVFLEGNVLDGSDAVTGENWLGVGFASDARATQPFAAAPVQTTDASTAYETVLAKAGAVPDRRDATDARVVQEVRAGKGRIINHASEVAAAPLDALRFERVAGTLENEAVLGNGAEGSFDGRWAACPSVVTRDGTYRMWYSSWYIPGFGPTGIGLATSADGIHWVRANQAQPVLTPGGSDAFDSGCVMGPTVLFDGTRYLMWYTGARDAKHALGFHEYRIGVASSRDGVTWTRENDGRPVIDLGPAGSPDEVQAATPSVVREKDGFRMWYAAWAPGPNHTICVARSADGITWERENGGRSVTGLDPAIAFGPSVCKVGERYFMLYMALAKPQGLYAAQSVDGITWNMLNEGMPVIVPSGNGYDRDLVGHPALLCRNHELFAWITGYDRTRGGVKDWRLSIGLVRSWLPK